LAPGSKRIAKCTVVDNLIEASFSSLPEYERIPIAFRVGSHFDIVPIDRGLGGLSFVEQVVKPHVKNYDAHENDRPSQWPRRFDMSH
jgi:hypothetical protein